MQKRLAHAAAPSPRPPHAHRSKREVAHIIKSARQSDTPSATKKELNYDLAVIRCAL